MNMERGIHPDIVLVIEADGLMKLHHKSCADVHDPNARSVFPVAKENMPAHAIRHQCLDEK